MLTLAVSEIPMVKGFFIASFLVSCIDQYITAQKNTPVGACNTRPQGRVLSARRALISMPCGHGKPPRRVGESSHLCCEATYKCVFPNEKAGV